MQNYDTVLKLLLQDLSNVLLEQITGTRLNRWLPIELPNVQNLHMDLLAESIALQLIHLELQSTNDRQMALRMAEYMLRVFRRYGRFPRQIVLYVGETPPTMPTRLEGPYFSFEYQLIDIRDLDAEILLSSPRLSDTVLSILCRLKDRRKAVRQVLDRIAQASGEERGVALQQLSILAGLRQLEDEVREEIKQMPVLNDIMDNKIIGTALKQGMQQGMQQGMRQVVRHQIEKRFGPMPASLETQFMELTTADLDAVALRVIDVPNVEDLFKHS